MNISWNKVMYTSQSSIMRRKHINSNNIMHKEERVQDVQNRQTFVALMAEWMQNQAKT